MIRHMFFKRIIIIMLIVFLFLPLIPLAKKEAYAAEKIKVSGADLIQGKQFTLVNMPNNSASSIRPVNYSGTVRYGSHQNFAYTPDGKYIFAIGLCTEGGRTHGFLARCRLPEGNDGSTQAVCEEVRILFNYGHNDSISITQSNLSKEEYQIWLSCKIGFDGYGTQIARLTYQVDQSGLGKIAKTVYISNFKKGNTKKGKAAYFVNKSSVLSLRTAIDEGSNQIVFRLRVYADDSYHYLSYNFKKLNAALDKVADKKKYNIAKAAKLQLAHIKCSREPRLSFQSFAVKGKCLYIAGGKFGIGAEIDVVKYKTQKKGKVKEQNKEKSSAISKIITINPKIQILDEWYDRDYLEIEGIQVQKNPGGGINYFMSFNCVIPRSRDVNSIYMITK